MERAFAVSDLAGDGCRLHELPELLEHEHLALAFADLAPALEGVCVVVDQLEATGGIGEGARLAERLSRTVVRAGLLEERGGTVEIRAAGHQRGGVM